jgi:hypothetical protein
MSFASAYCRQLQAIPYFSCFLNLKTFKPYNVNSGISFTAHHMPVNIRCNFQPNFANDVHRHARDQTSSVQETQLSCHDLELLVDDTTTHQNQNKE